MNKEKLNKIKETFIEHITNNPNHIIGEPSKLGFYIEKIEKWSDETWKNGYFYLFINGKLFPQIELNTTLNCDVSYILDKTSPLMALPQNKEIFELEVHKAVNILYRNRTAWDSEENDYTYTLDLPTMMDNGAYVFLVASNNKVRILATNIEYIPAKDDDSEDEYKILSVEDIVLDRNEIASLTDNLRVMYDKI